MKAIYWSELNCTHQTRKIEHVNTIHEHFDDEQDACRAFLSFMAISEDEWLAGRRYRCIRGPGGIVRSVA